MPQTDYTLKILDMEHMDVLDVKNYETKIEMLVRMKRRTHSCPKCQSLTNTVHDYRSQIVKDSPIHGKHVMLKYEKRRYICKTCGKRFYENNYLLPKWHRITNRLVARCLQMLKKKQSQKDIAEALGVSPSSVGRWLKLIEYGKPKILPKVVSIDEFKGDTDYGKYQCILTAPLSKSIVDILPTRYSMQVYEYIKAFSNRKEVEYFVTDMRKDYIQIAEQLLPNATIVIDKFHVMRYCTWAFENVRKREQKKLYPEDRKYFKRSRKVLLCHMNKLSVENKLAAERMISYFEDLSAAYLLKEKFYAFMDSKSMSEAKRRLHEFRLFAHTANLREFDTCLRILKNWEQYILNAFDCGYSNGYTEGVNNSIKVIKRIAYGYTNFHNFRRRILATING